MVIPATESPQSLSVTGEDRVSKGVFYGVKRAELTRLGDREMRKRRLAIELGDAVQDQRVGLG